MNPYTLPEGNVQIAFSAGRSSGKMLHDILEANGTLPDRAVVTFNNTAKEMAESYDFAQECSERWSVPVVWVERAPPQEITQEELELVAETMGDQMAARLEAWWEVTESGFHIVSHNRAARNGEPFIALVLQRGYLPNQASRYCSIELKVRTAKRYLMSLGWEYWTNAVGLRADEPTRLKEEGVKHGDRWTIWQPLANAGVSKRDVAEFWRHQSFDLRLPNVNGNCWLGNCDGCFLKSEANIAALTRDYPEQAAWWEGMERLAAKLTSGTGAQFSKRYSREELRTFMERQGDWALSTEGALCQASDGECFA